MAQKTALITGGAGFIGSHLCDALLASDYRVICVDNLVTGSEDNIQDAKKHSNFTFIRHDVVTPLTLSDHIDYIFHLASPASVIDYQNLPQETALVNSLGTIHLLELARQAQAKFLFASTSEVYGDPKEHPQKETYWGNVNPNGIRACYDESKRFGEMMTFLYMRKYQIDTRIIRIFNTYGPRMRKTDGRVISNFINQALEEKPLTVYGDGTQTRSFCFVSDLVKGIIAAMMTASTMGEVINLGNPQEFTMIDIAKKIQAKTGSRTQIVYSALPADDPKQRKPSIEKAKSQLAWEPVVSVDEGLDQTIAYYKSLS